MSWFVGTTWLGDDDRSAAKDKPGLAAGLFTARQLSTGQDRGHARRKTVPLVRFAGAAPRAAAMAVLAGILMNYSD
jgi:hypothetical protein